MIPKTIRKTSPRVVPQRIMPLLRNTHGAKYFLTFLLEKLTYNITRSLCKI